jgi:hypothetical protein
MCVVGKKRYSQSQATVSSQRVASCKNAERYSASKYRKKDANNTRFNLLSTSINTSHAGIVLWQQSCDVKFLKRCVDGQSHSANCMLLSMVVGVH